MTEQELLNSIWPDDDTKSMSDIITEFRKVCSSDSTAILSIKECFPDVSDWSI